MTEEQQRIAIAEACGWSITGFISDCGMDDVAILPPGVSFKDEGAVWTYAGLGLPDYLNDLNAMFEAEKVLTPSQWPEYAKHIRAIALREAEDGTDIYGRYIHAAAAQRAEAFLRTIGKWKE